MSATTTVKLRTVHVDGDEKWIDEIPVEILTRADAIAAWKEAIAEAGPTVRGVGIMADGFILSSVRGDPAWKENHSEPLTGIRPGRVVIR